MQQLVEKPDIIKQITDNFDKTLTLSHHHHHHHDNHNDDGDNDDDFEFIIQGDRYSPISADDIFENGQIRPVFPFSDETSRNSDGATTSYTPPVKKLFVASSPEKEKGEIPEGPYCEWSPEKSTPAPEMRRKSNSTGFSKLWKVRDLLVRSHSDGKDTFVFLGKSEEKVAAKIRVSKGEGKGKGKGKKSAYEELYGKKKKKKEGKGGKSYLPYRQELLVGFFTNTSGGMTKNVHPY